MKTFLSISIIIHTVFFAGISLFSSHAWIKERTQPIEISFYEGKGHRPEKTQKKIVKIVKPAEIFPIIKQEIFEKKPEEKLREPETFSEAPSMFKNETIGPAAGPVVPEAGYGSGTTAVDPEVAAWFSSVKERVERYKKYPKKALEESIEGKVILEITVESSGILNKVNVYFSSGSLLLDGEAVRTVKVASPFKPCPLKLGKSVTFRLPLKFEVMK